MIRLLDAPAFRAAGPCASVCARVFEFLDGELPPDEFETVSRHLAACGSCWSRAERDGRFLDVVRRHTRVERASPSFRRRLLATLQHEAEPRRPD